jgi:hypothetical protein
MVGDDMKLSQILSDKKLSSVVMINIMNHNDNAYSYSLWKLEQDKLYLFDDEYKVGHLLYLDWDIQEIEPNTYYITTNQSFDLKIDLYFGGAVLD